MMWASGISFTKSSPHICFFLCPLLTDVPPAHLSTTLPALFLLRVKKRKEKHAKLILLVTLVLIHNHNLFLMKR